MEASSEDADAVFDYRALRLLVGLIAFVLPFAVTLLAKAELASISASYHDDASRDLFVGLLFVVAAFLWAYNGHDRCQKISSKVAAVSAACVAVFPTAEKGQDHDLDSIIHFTAAGILFLILAYFCLGPFRHKKDKLSCDPKKAARRRVIYLVCGWVILLAMAVIAATSVFPGLKENRAVYWAEAVALGAFGVAWFVAGKLNYLKPLVGEEEALYLFKSKKGKS